MATHRKNEDFYLYTGLCLDNGDCFNALTHLRGLQVDGFQFIHLHYGDPSQHESVLNNLKTWGPDLDDLAFPFVHYTEVNDVTDSQYKNVVFVKGLQNIQNTDWVSLYNFANNDPVPVPELAPEANTPSLPPDFPGFPEANTGS